MYTEEQAGEKFCCEANADGSTCCTSKCMAWRWAEVRDPTYPECSEGLTMRYVKSDEFGYCGLAGKP